MKFAKMQLIVSLVLYFIFVNLILWSGIEIFLITKITNILFFLFVPGVMSLKILKTNITKLDFILYSFGISLVHLFITGLICNWIVPFFGIARPLTYGPLIIVFDISIFILLTILYFAGPKSYILDLSGLSSNTIKRIFLFVPLFFIPLLGYFGAVLINNHGPSWLIILMYVCVIFYLLFFAFFKQSKWLYPLSLYLISLGFLFAGSMRSFQIAGPDPAMEYGLSHYLLKAGRWNYWDVNNNYYGMLSIVLLQPMLALFFKTSIFTVIKVVFPAFFSFVPVVLFSLFKKIADEEKAYYGSIFFIIQPNFVVWNLFPPRQEIAFLFMSLMYLTLFDKRIFTKTRSIFFLIFGFSLVVSHYSTTYVTSIVIIVGYLLSKLYILWRKNDKNISMRMTERSSVPLTGMMVLLFLIIEVFWYFQFTNIGIKAVNIIDNKLFSNAFSLDSSPLNIFSKKIPQKNKYYLIEYVDAVSKIKITSFSSSTTNKYPSRYESTSEIGRATLYPVLYPIFEKIKILLLVIGGLSVVIGFIRYIKIKDNAYIFYLILSLVSFSILAFFVPLPFVSSYYDPIRLFLQFLILLSVFSIFAFDLLDKSQPNLGKKVFIIFGILYFAFLSHFIFYFIGGGRAQLILANAGKDYDLHYTISNEIKSMDWLLENNKNKNMMVFDNYGQFKLYQSDYYSLNSNIKLDVLPQSINKNDYVYASRANVVQGITFKYSSGGLLIYNFPKEFLEDNKNQIYSNGKSAIYK